MTAQVRAIAFHTFRDAVRDRVLYNLVVFALLMVGAALLVGQISIGVERIILVNLGLASIALFGAAISIFVGVGLVSKEIERRTLYTVLTRPVRRWEFIAGKYLGLVATLTLNASLMAAGFFVALFLVARTFVRTDVYLLIALYFILLQFLIITGLALLFSTFSSPLLSTVFAMSMFVIGSFAQDLRAVADATSGAVKWPVVALSYLMPDLSSLNVVTRVAHSQPIAGSLVLWNSAYALLYSLAAVSAAVLIFERRDLK